MTQPITLNQRTATTVTQLLDRMNQAQETLRTYVEAVGSALDVPPGWRFDTQTMAFMPPAGELTGETEILPVIEVLTTEDTVGGSSSADSITIGMGADTIVGA